MKRTLFFLVLGLLLATTAKGQIKIGDNPQTIDPSSVLELESGSRVLVVTRVSTAEMNAITPLPGAVVYNTDLGCVHYYNGTEWINICEEVGGIPNLTTDPFINTRSTIVITTDGENNHIEVAPNSIRTEQIVDGGINGDDIQDNSIGQNKIGNDAVGANELEENAVGVEALNNVEVETYLEDYFTNTVGYITSANILSTDPDNDLTDVDGAFYDEQPVLDAIATNAGDISTNAGDIQTNSDAITVNTGNIGTNTSAISANTTAIGTKEDAANKSDDTTLGNSAVLFPTQNAVKTYVDGQIGGINSDDDITDVTFDGTTLTVEEGSTSFGANLSALEESADIAAVQLDVDNNEADADAALLLKENLTNKSTNINLGTSNTLYPSQRAVKLYVDAQVSGVGGTGDITSTDITVTGGTDAAFADVTLAIANDAVTSIKIADGEVQTADIDDDAVTTDKILNANITEAKIAPGTANQILRTNATGTAVTWVDLPVGSGSTEEADGTTITGIGTNADPFRIQPVTPTPATNQMLITNTAGDIDWIPATTGGGTTEEADQTTIAGIGTNADPFRIQPVTPAPATNQMLITNTAGNIDWIPAATGGGTTEEADQTTITGIGTNADPFRIQPVTPAPATNQMLITDTAGNIDWIPAATGGGTTEIADGFTISGDGQLGTEFQVADNGINTLQLADDAVTSAKIADGEVQTADIDDDAVTTAKILNANITEAKIAPGTADQILRTNATGTAVSWVDLPSLGTTEIADGFTISGDGQLGTEFQVADNGINTLQLADDAVTSEKIGDGEVQTVDIDDDAVTTAKILNANITEAKIAPGTADQILRTNATGTAVSWVDLPSLGTTEIADGITISGDGQLGTEFQVADNGINTLQLADDAVTSEKIGDGEVQTVDIDDDAVTTAKILNANITEAKIAPGTADQILRTNATGTAVSWVDLPSLGTTEIADGITISGDGQLGTEFQVADNGIKTLQLADDAVTSAKIDDATIEDIDVSATAAIAGTKIDPDFGALPVATTGTLAAGNTAVTGTLGVTGQTTINVGAASTALPTDRGSANQVLTTDGAGLATWATPPTGTIYSAGEAITLSVANEFSVTDNEITSTKIEDATIEDIDVSATAAIAGTKIDPDFGALPVATTGTLAAGNTAVTGTLGITGQTTINVGAASTALPTDRGSANQVLTTDGAGLATWATPPTGTIYSAGAAITLSVANEFSVTDNEITSIKIEDATIEDIDVSATAAIAGTKIDPDFGALPVATTGTLAAGNTAVTGTLGITGQTTINVGAASTALPTDRGSANQVLTTDGAGLATWATTSSTNLENTNLTQTSGEDRTYDLNGSNLFFRDNSGLPITGNVGIGNLTGAPESKLDVAGQIQARQGFASSDGTVGEPAYSFYTDDDTNTGMYRISADEIGFSVGGNLALTIDEPRVGITNVLVNGAFSAQIRTESGLGAITIAEDDYTVIIENATSVTLPNPSTSGVDLNVGKIHILKNITGGIIPISSYNDSSGSTSTSLATGVTQLQSDGTTWHQIN